MKIVFDIGGVISKFPHEFKELIKVLQLGGIEIFVITDMHDMQEITQMLQDNGFSNIPKENIHTADYAQFGEFCKAKLLKELHIDMFFDDFIGYHQWDSQLGKAPIRLLVSPDGFQPYWHNEWKVPKDHDFGRRTCTKKQLEQP